MVVIIVVLCLVIALILGALVLGWWLERADRKAHL